MTLREYEGIGVEVRANGVALVTIRGADKVNSLTERHHRELATVWPDLSAEDDVRVIVVTGEGAVFCAGGNLDMERRLAGDHPRAVQVMSEARDLVLNIVNCDKPIISAINGAAVGAGLAAALLADISVIGDDVVLTDGHTRIGLVAGDHAVLIWPLLCGMARTKYYLLTCERIDGRTAAEIGLVSKATERTEVLGEAMRIADRLAAGPQYALRWTKRSLNQWLRMALPAFETSLGLETLTLLGPDFAEGIDAFATKREPSFGHDADGARPDV
jgi:enoyl-CoA hydratase